MNLNKTVMVVLVSSVLICSLAIGTMYVGANTHAEMLMLGIGLLAVGAMITFMFTDLFKEGGL